MPPPAVSTSARARPRVSVIVPFAGNVTAAARTVAAIDTVRLGPHDEVVLADSTPANVVAALDLPAGWRLVHARGEASPARARNAGALQAMGDWLLFVDSDCRPEPDLIEAYLGAEIPADCGLVAGRIDNAMPGSPAVRAQVSRRVRDQSAGVGAPVPAWAHTANLLVRREVWSSLGGFLEGILNAEDVDFCWRAQRAGWTLAYNDHAVVTHERPASLRGLWRRRVAQVASERWLHRRWPEVPAPSRAPGRALLRSVLAVPAFLLTGRVKRARMEAMDGLMATADIVGQGASNRARPLPCAQARADRVAVHVWVDQFPVLSETFVVGEIRELAALGHPVEVLALERPAAPALGVHDVAVRYVEDDTGWDRVRAFAWLAARHPVGVVGDRLAALRWRAHETVPGLWVLAPALRRLSHDQRARIHVHFAAHMALSALRARRLTGRRWSLTAHAYDIYLMPRNLEEKLRSADIVTSGCDYTVRDLRTLAGPEHADHIHRIVMGVDPAQFARGRPYPHDATVVAIGRLVEKKGFSTLIRAAAEPALASVLDQVTIVGDGPLRQALQAEIDDLGLGGIVQLRGKLEPAAVRDALEDAAILAMPCVVARDGDRDSMPVVVKEALAMEIPVVVSDEVGLPELARPQFARVVPPGDHVALARALADLLALPPQTREQMGRAGRAFVTEHANIRLETARLSALLDPARRMPG